LEKYGAFQIYTISATKVHLPYSINGIISISDRIGEKRKFGRKDALGLFFYQVVHANGEMRVGTTAATKRKGKSK